MTLDPLTRCRNCEALFLQPEEEDLSGLTLLACPLCGSEAGCFDEVPGHFEMAWYWQVIERSFDTKERTTLRLLAFRNIELPEA